MNSITFSRRFHSKQDYTFVNKEAHLGLPIAQHHHPQRSHVQAGKKLLRQQDIRTLVGQIIQPRVNIHMSRGIHQRPRAALHLGIVSLPVNELRDLLHVGNPVDFRI